MGNAHNTATVVFLLLSILKKYEINSNSNRENYRISNTKILDGHIHAAGVACHAYGRFPIPQNLNGIDFRVPERESFADFLDRKNQQ
jgi:hypothetical protein